MNMIVNFQPLYWPWAPRTASHADRQTGRWRYV